jgi:ribosomal protein L30E
VGDLNIKKTRGVAKTNAKIQKMGKHKAIVIGDSHPRGCAEKVSSYLGNTYEVIGYVSPNAGLEVITDCQGRNEQLT